MAILNGGRDEIRVMQPTGRTAETRGRKAKGGANPWKVRDFHVVICCPSENSSWTWVTYSLRLHFAHGVNAPKIREYRPPKLRRGFAVTRTGGNGEDDGWEMPSALVLVRLLMSDVVKARGAALRPHHRPRFPGAQAPAQRTGLGRTDAP